jgi:benzylsuccinate CoA-transferase BbsF subunit
VTAPLAGLRILDFCWIGAGALVTKALAELGAEVIRVESRSHPDNLRLTPPFRPGTEGLEASGYFASRNPNKKSFALNMSHPEAREIARELIAKVDAVTSNFRPGVMVKWGLSYEDVKVINPEIVYLVMPMQGTDGPHRSFIGFGSTIAALGGLVHLTGEPGRIPVGTGTHYPDHVPNPGHSLVAILAALFEKHRTGRGQRIELSQLESTLNTIGPAFLASAVGEELGPSGNALPGVVPRGLYRTGDDHWVIIACPTDDIWDRLSALMIADGAERDLQSLSLGERESRADEIDDAVSAWVSKRDRADVLNLLEDARVPNGQVNTSADVLDDPVLRGRRFWDTIEHPVIGEMPMFRLPFIREPGGRQPMTRPPLLGEHTWEVASEILGMDRERFEALTSAEILY